MGKIKQLIEDYDGYEEAFPFEQEYEMWIAGIERDFVDEANYRAQIAADEDRDNFVYISDEEEELSPFATINS